MQNVNVEKLAVTVEKRQELFPNMADDSGEIYDIDDLEEVPVSYWDSYTGRYCG